MLRIQNLGSYSNDLIIIWLAYQPLKHQTFLKIENFEKKKKLTFKIR